MSGKLTFFVFLFDFASLIACKLWSFIILFNPGYYNIVDESGKILLNKILSIEGLDESKKTVLLKEFIKQGANVNISDNDGNTPLHEASKNKNIEVVKLLIKHGAEIDPRNNKKNTPLIFATENNNFEVVKLLVKNGANTTVGTSDGYDLTLIKIAKEEKNEAIINFLKNYEEMFNATNRGELEKIKKLRDNGVPLTIRGQENNTLLHIAADSGRLDVVKYLIGNGLSVNIKNVDGDTPLDLAEGEDEEDVVEFLKRIKK